MGSRGYKDKSWIMVGLWLAIIVKLPLTELPFWSIWGQLECFQDQELWMLPRWQCSGGSIWGQIWDVLGSETRLFAPSCLNHLSSLKVWQHWTLEKEGRKHPKTSCHTQLNSVSNNQIQSTCWWYYGDNETAFRLSKRDCFWTQRILSVRRQMS